jgi:hypothetical protein
MAHRPHGCHKHLLWLSAAPLIMLAVGCGESCPPNTSPLVTAASSESSAPKGNAIADPLLRQARDQADALLLGLLQGKFDEDDNLALVAEKLKGYTSWSITSQTRTGQRTAQFKGTISKAAGKATFQMTLVKQSSGQWAISKFSGPTS